MTKILCKKSFLPKDMNILCFMAFYNFPIFLVFLFFLNFNGFPIFFIFKLFLRN